MSPLSNTSIPISSETNENQSQDTNYSQQLRQTDVIIPLNDCMQCFVKIQPYQVKKKLNRHLLK